MSAEQKEETKKAAEQVTFSELVASIPKPPAALTTSTIIYAFLALICAIAAAFFPAILHKRPFDYQYTNDLYLFDKIPFLCMFLIFCLTLMILVRLVFSLERYQDLIDRLAMIASASVCIWSVYIIADRYLTMLSYSNYKMGVATFLQMLTPILVFVSRRKLIIERKLLHEQRV